MPSRTSWGHRSQHERYDEILRIARALVLSGLGTIALHCPSVSFGQQALQSFGEVDFFYSQQPQLFQQLWQAAQTQTVRIAVLGDSQETSPNSQGFRYIPRLNYELWKRFGNSPETPVVGCFGYGNTSPGHWLLAGRCTTPGPTTIRLSSTRILPNVRATAFSTLNSATNITGGDYGQLTMLEQDAADVDPSAGIPTNVSYFDTSGVVKARIFAATNPSSGEVAYQARPSATSSPSYTAAVTTSGTLNLGLRSPTFAIKWGDTSALHFNSNRYMALEVFGTSDTNLTDIIGLRFFSETRPEGVVIDTFSLGGYTAARFLRDHADAGPMFRAFGFHAAIIHYGANEAGRVTAEAFRSDLSAVISRVRAWAGDAAFPIILIADVYQSRPSQEEMRVYDRYVGAQLAIAQADSNVMVINARRLMENIGWNASSGRSDQYLNDGIHYTALGAQVLAAAVVSALMGEIHVSGCPSDPRAVSLRSSMTLIVDLGGTAACTNHGQLRVARSLTLNQPALEVVLKNGFVPSAGDQFKLLAFATASGSFGSITLPVLPSGLSWSTSALYTTGTLGVVAKQPDPAPIPAPPTINVTSEATQSVTLPNAPSPIGFTVSGSGPLTVTASSSNTAVLPDSGISISSGCGAGTLSCAATLSLTSGQTGSSTVSLTVTDTHAQTAVATARVEVDEAEPEAGAETGSGSGSGTGTGTGTGGEAGTGGQAGTGGEAGTGGDAGAEAGDRDGAGGGAGTGTGTGTGTGAGGATGSTSGGGGGGGSLGLLSLLGLAAFASSLRMPPFIAGPRRRGARGRALP